MYNSKICTVWYVNRKNDYLWDSVCLVIIYQWILVRGGHHDPGDHLHIDAKPQGGPCTKISYFSVKMDNTI